MNTDPLQKFISDIDFKNLQPLEEFPEGFGGNDALLHLAPRIRTLVETWNTVLPVTNEVFTQLQDTGSVPRMSTLAVGAIIQFLVRQMPANQAYVNVGFWHGFSLFAGMIGNESKRCIGIDNFSQFGTPQLVFLEEFAKRKSSAHQFFIEDYRVYFAKHHDPIGLYFYDGDHAYEHQKEGLALAEPYMADGGYILVDDTNWDEPREATQDFLEEHAGKYECILDLRTAENGHPTFWNGIMVLRKKGASADS